MCTLFVAPLMSLLVLLCFLVTTLIAFCGTHATNEVRYEGLNQKQFKLKSGIVSNFLKKIRHQSMHQASECGPHGKFEYCIDGIPGCVIGCHCHPGYYFDTDTKICELNVKLTQDFRRHYPHEPTHLHEPPAIAHATDATVSTPSPTNNNADKIDEIPKDTDELGDWLYNQFFKTIESQVINKSNNTKPETKEKPPTRRSGGNSAPAINKSRRKARKSIRMRSSRKKKHSKVHGLRRKLLRITEDDSLFDSDSDSDYSGSSSGSEDYSESSSGSAESSDGNGKKSSDKDDKDHGHKKVIIFNRRPKPPLPSFIFLPSMDTPYYPPIGLPPPPPMPMYPMVPVPPMAPPMFPPFPVPPPCDEEGSGATTTSGATTSAGAPTTTVTTPAAAPGQPAAPGETTAPGDTSDTAVTDVTEATEATEATATGLRKGDRRSRFEKRLRRPMPEDFIARANAPGKSKKLKHDQRNNLMHKLRKQMEENEKSQINMSAAELDHLGDEDSVNAEDVPILPEAFPRHKSSKHKPEMTRIPKLEDVDFTYLSQLIHRVNESQAKHKLASLPSDLNKDLEEIQKIQAQQTRRTLDSYKLPPINVYPEVNQHRNLQKAESDDVYYTNLGRKIAAMIRNADSQLNSQFKEGSENRQLPFHSVLNENSHMPQSYWERSVRSPLKQLRPFSNYLEESRTLRHSNERSLLNLENEVETFAATPKSLSLQDLENILNTMQKAQAHIELRQPLSNTQRSELSMNVNLLPKYITPATYRRLLNEPKHVEYFTEHFRIPTTAPPKVYVRTHAPNVTNLTVFHKTESNYNSPFNDYWMYSNNQQAVKPISIPVATSKPVPHDTPEHHTSPVRPPPPPLGPELPEPSPVKTPHTPYLSFLRSMPIVKQATAKKYEVKVGNLNYFTGNKHHYMFEQSSYPLLTPFKRQIKQKHGHPSYFHPELHHFEFFD